MIYKNLAEILHLDQDGEVVTRDELPISEDESVVE